MATSYTLTVGSTSVSDSIFVGDKRLPKDFLREPPSRYFYHLLLESYNIRWQQQISMSNDWDKQHRHELVALRVCVIHKNCTHNVYIACPLICLDHYRTAEYDVPLPADLLNRYLERMFL